MAVVVSNARPLVAAGLFLLVVGLNAGAGLYRERLTLSALDDLPAILGRALVAGAVVMSALLLIDGRVNDRKITIATLTWAALLVALRALGYAHIRTLRERRRRSNPTLILGAGRIGGRIARTLLQHAEYGMLPVGFVDDDPLLAPDDRPVPVLGTYAALSGIIRKHRVKHVVIAFPRAREADIVAFVRQCDRLDCEIFIVPRLFELSPGSAANEHMWGLPLSRLPRPAFRSSLWQLKRASDVLLAGVALLVLWPVMALSAVLVRRETGDRILFRQQRVGVDGIPFQLLKFQTLRPETAEEGATLWNVSQDDRLGPVGRVLRKTSLDELPQLWNILRGDMTIVGPRPERPYYVQRFTSAFPHYMARHRVPAGLTGWAQIHDLRGDTSIEDRAWFDNYYIENWSLWGDVKIMLRTLLPVLRGGGG